MIRISILSILICLNSQSQIILRGGSVRGGILGKPTGSASTITSVDDFSRADANPISNPMSDGISTWTTPLGSSGVMQLQFNAMVSASAQSVAKVSSPTFPANQSVTNIINANNSFGINCGPMVRIQSGSSSGYLLYLVDTTHIQIYTVTDSGSQVFTPITSSTVITAVQAGDKLVFSVSGTTLTAIFNGSTIVSTTDSTYSTGQPGEYSASTGNYIKGFSATSLP